MNLTTAAAHLGVASKTLRLAAERGDVHTIHPLDDGPWIFKRGDLEEPTFRAKLESRVTGHLHPAGPSDAQLTLNISMT